MSKHETSSSKARTNAIGASTSALIAFNDDMAREGLQGIEDFDQYYEFDAYDDAGEALTELVGLLDLGASQNGFDGAYLNDFQDDRTYELS